MNPLSWNNCRNLLSAVETLHSTKSLEQFPTAVFSALSKVISYNTMCYNEVALPDSIVSWIIEPADARPGPLLKESFMRNYTEHPVFLHYSRTGDISTYKISDFVSRRHFHGSALYNEYYRQSGVEYQLATALMPGSDRMIAITLDRNLKDFSENESLSLDLLRPHLMLAYHNVQTLELMKRVVEGGGEKIIIVNRSGQVALADDDAWRLISKYFHVSPLQRYLPDILQRWIIHERARLGDDHDFPSPPVPLVVSQDDRKLKVSLLWGGESSGQDILLIEEESAEITHDLLIDEQLTGREHEILTMLSMGKTNSEIGLALSISPLTVKKHLENIYSKLQVHTRGAAVARYCHL